MLIVQTPAPVDPNFLISQLIPLVGSVVALIVGGIVLYAFVKSDLAKAMAERIRAKTHRRSRWKGFGDESETPVEGVEAGQVAELEQRVDVMQDQIAEMAERLDFAERLLAQKRERSLPGA